MPACVIKWLTLAGLGVSGVCIASVTPAAVALAGPGARTLLAVGVARCKRRIQTVHQAVGV